MKINEKLEKKADIIVDLQFGSTGKGAIAGYMAVNGDYDTVVTANRPNAGHTFIDNRGNKMIHKIMPNGVVGPKVTRVLIGPGAVFSMDQLEKEVSELVAFGYDQFTVFIHEAAVLLTEEHKQGEMEFSRIGSTQQGSATAIVHKMERDPKNSPLAKEWKGHHPRIKLIDAVTYMEFIIESENILLEGAQGYSLGIDAGFWPYCTSRNCTVNQFMSDMAIPHTMLRKVIGTARTYPIRVGGTSGPGYPDQMETSWETLRLEDEFTTVTGRKRRVFTFSFDQIIEAMIANQPNEIFLNFCNYIGEAKTNTLADRIDDLATRVAPQCEVKYLGWGPTVSDIQEIV